MIESGEFHGEAAQSTREVRESMTAKTSGQVRSVSDELAPDMVIASGLLVRAISQWSTLALKFLKRRGVWFRSGSVKKSCCR